MIDKSNKKHLVKIKYKNDEDELKEVVMPFEEEEYDNKMDYKDNVGALAAKLYEEGGTWISRDTIVPFHRILSINCFYLDNNNNNNNKKNNRFRNRRHQKVKTDDKRQ